MVGAVAEMGILLLEEDSLDSILDKAIRLTKRTVRGAEEVSLTLGAQRPTTVMFTGDWALAADERQYELGEGPCRDACEGGTTQVVGDFETEKRWPLFAPAASALGVGSAVTVPLPIRGAQATLNVYSSKRRVFFDREVGEVQTFAAFVATAICNAEVYRKTPLLAEQLEQTLARRSVRPRSAE